MMRDLGSFLSQSKEGAISLIPLTGELLPSWMEQQSAFIRSWVKQQNFQARPGTFIVIPDSSGAIEKVAFGSSSMPAYTDTAALPMALPAGDYRLPDDLDQSRAEVWALGWGMGSYGFHLYKKPSKNPAVLVWPKNCRQNVLTHTLESIFWVRDLVNTPANDMGPQDLVHAAEKLAQTHKAQITVISGDALLDQNYPLAHAVGQASCADRSPQLIDLRWGPPDAPKVTLVGKGVCFDTGGLDIKPPANMLLMKKDMGGAAHALALAHMIMALNLPMRLRVLIPAVDNAVGPKSFRPLDVIKSRKGLTVEVSDTDAEGRLILADALAEACSEKPHLLLDFSTLTGAARVALGPDIPAFFTDDEKLARCFSEAASTANDPVWRLPLWKEYRRGLDSPIADIRSMAPHSYAGAIIAALFLQSFVEPDVPWAHIDLMAWNTGSRPGRPEGGEAMALRASFDAICQWIGIKIPS